MRERVLMHRPAWNGLLVAGYAMKPSVYLQI